MIVFTSDTAVLSITGDVLSITVGNNNDLLIYMIVFFFVWTLI